MGKYFIVDSAILPDVLVKVVEARDMIRNGKARRITTASKAVGISRGTYYKYKDRIFAPGFSIGNRKHLSGVLSNVLDQMSSVKANIITLNQNIPIHDVASVVISFDMADMEIGIEDLVKKLDQITGVHDVRLEAVE